MTIFKMEKFTWVINLMYKFQPDDDRTTEAC
jgi:hypothetical protein